MADLIKCLCSACGAKYRLPAEFQGRTAKCKKCGEKFSVPRSKTVEDSVLDWLSEEEAAPEEEAAKQPRVIDMKRDVEASTHQNRGVIRVKSNDES